MSNDRNNPLKNQSTYYNIDIYNNNKTNANINALFSMDFQSPLIDKPQDHEVSVVRARIPLDGIPISQSDIPFNQWGIQMKVGGVTTSGFVSQFGQAIDNEDYFSNIIAIPTLQIQDMRYNNIGAQTATFSPDIVPVISNYLLRGGLGFTFDITYAGNIPISEADLMAPVTGLMVLTQSPEFTGLIGDYIATQQTSNVVYGTTMMWSCTDRVNIVNYLYGNPNPIETWNIRSIGKPNCKLVAMCGDGDELFIIINNPDDNNYMYLSRHAISGSILPFDSYYDSCVFTAFSISQGRSVIAAISNDHTYEFASSYTSKINKTITLYSYIDSHGTKFNNNNPYKSTTQFNSWGNPTQLFTLPVGYILKGLLGSDTINNILVSVEDTSSIGYLMAFNKVTGVLNYYCLTTNIAIALSKFSNAMGPPNITTSLPHHAVDVLINTNIYQAVNGQYQTDLIIYNTGNPIPVNTLNLTQLIDLNIIVCAMVSNIGNSGCIFVCQDMANPSMYYLVDYANPAGKMTIDSYGSTDLIFSTPSTKNGYFTLSYSAYNADLNTTTSVSKIIHLVGGAFTLINTLEYITTEMPISLYYEYFGQDNWYVGEMNTNEFSIFNAGSGVLISNIILPAGFWLKSFVGNDLTNNIVATVYNQATSQYCLMSWDIHTNAMVSWFATPLGRILTMGQYKHIQTSTIVANPTGLYKVWNIQEFVDQINLCFKTVYNQCSIIGTTCPYLIVGSNGLFEIVTDNSFVSTLASPNTIEFTQVLFNQLKFLSTKSAYGVLLKIFANQPNNTYGQVQQSPTIYKFIDITRIVVQTTKMGVKGDCELSATVLLSINDFIVNTTQGVPEIIVYEPSILRWYQLYQTTPLTNLNIFITYADKAGIIYPIHITPYNSVGLKLQFRNSNVVQYSDI